MPEGSLGDFSTLPPRFNVGKAEVNPLVHSRVNDVPRCIRKSRVYAGLLKSEKIGRIHEEDHLVRPEEQLQNTRHRTVTQFARDV